ncbi:hypothetical protein [Sediminicola luteus]|uniref:Uncharacterized protein n=1 Tax=Sediminicola luteus TaxID=319238 RepID=A0A2A4G1E9_9FLAO|nr:hypothetical protein [Sediminicola luteus]PCE62517.1 hypothetical protein B7P33_17935 [Sediminicola luteus]
MKYKVLLILIFGVFVCCRQNGTDAIPENYGLYKLQGKTSYLAGDPINMAFEGEPRDSLRLWVDNVWGSTVLTSIDSLRPIFSLPEVLRNKSGYVSWALLIGRKKLLHGGLTIEPAQINKTMMETYMGPPSIFNHKNDKGMFVAFPQDVYGNPVRDASEVWVNKEMGDRKETEVFKTEHMIVYDYIYPGTKPGKIFVSAQFNDQVSKEMVTYILPTYPTDFTIDSQRVHDFADGNQMVTLNTSIIRDRYGNTVADGTLVRFHIAASSGGEIQTVGQTLNGVARGMVLHPEQPEIWQVSAIIPKRAFSNTIRLGFKAAVLDFDIRFEPQENLVVLGPIKGYMQQLVPDGLSVSLTILDPKGKRLHHQFATTQNGFGKIYLPSFLQGAEGRIQAKVSGITKEIELP